MRSEVGCRACATLGEDNPHPPLDGRGHRLRVGDTARIVGVPSLAGMGTATLAQTKPGFEHLVGQYKRITDFDGVGWGRRSFRIGRRLQRRWHTVWIQSLLLRKLSRRTT